MLHVEIVRNEWAEGRQRVVATVSLTDEGLGVEAVDGDPTWEARIVQPFQDPSTGETVDPSIDAERFVRTLHMYVNGDYLFATQAHEQGDCEYPVGEELPFRVTSAME